MGFRFRAAQPESLLELLLAMQIVNGGGTYLGQLAVGVECKGDRAEVFFCTTLPEREDCNLEESAKWRCFLSSGETLLRNMIAERAGRGASLAKMLENLQRKGTQLRINLNEWDFEIPKPQHDTDNFSAVLSGFFRISIAEDVKEISISPAGNPSLKVLHLPQRSRMIERGDIHTVFDLRQISALEINDEFQDGGSPVPLPVIHKSIWGWIATESQRFPIDSEESQPQEVTTSEASILATI